MRPLRFAPVIALCLATAAVAQVGEIYSRYVQVFQPHGEYPQTLVKAAPASGEGWRLVDDQKTGYRIQVPESAEIDATASGNRVLQVVLAGGPQKPRPLFRVDAFEPEEDDPILVDEKYATDYAENYPDLAFNGKFNVSNSGMVVVSRRKPKINLAMVGGSYLQGAVPCYRMQFAYLSKGKQLFLTFDCQERDWPKHAPVIARMLLSLELPAAKKD